MLQEIIKKWVVELNLRNLSAHTKNAYQHDLEDFLHFLQHYNNGDNVDLSLLKMLQAQTIRAWLTERKDMHVRSNRRALSGVKSFIVFLKRHQYLDNNVFLKFKGPRTPKALPRPLSQDQTIDLLKNIKIMSDKAWVILRNQALFTLLYSTGLRIGEALALNNEHVDGEFLIINGKGSKQRMVPLLLQVKNIIRQYQEILPFAINNSTPLFYGEKGKRLQPAIAQRLIAQYRKIYNLPDSLTPHTMRHSCATHLMESSQNLRLIQEILGHASLSSTQIYTQVSQEQILQNYQKYHPRFEQ